MQKECAEVSHAAASSVRDIEPAAAVDPMLQYESQRQQADELRSAYAGNGTGAEPAADGRSPRAVRLAEGDHITRAGLVKATLEARGQWSAGDEARLASAEEFGTLARESGLLKGDGDTGALRLDDPVTRVEAAIIVARAFDLPSLDASQVIAPFSDLDPTHWAAPHIYGAALIGVITGLPGGLFAPLGLLLVEHAVAFLEKAASPPGAPSHDPTKKPAIFASQVFRVLSGALVESAPERMREKAAEAVPEILKSCLETGVNDPSQVAYLLATAQHESGLGGTMVEYGNRPQQNADGSYSAKVHVNNQWVNAPDRASLETAYWDSAYGHKNGNVKGTTDGRDFRGRGLVQLTGRGNYENMTQRLADEGFSYTHDGVTYGSGEGETPIDLAAHPEHVNEVMSLAARVMVLGARDGTFTGRSLDDFIGPGGDDFTNARSIINSDVLKNGASIADIARGFEAVLTAGGAWDTLVAEHTAAAGADTNP